MKNRWTRVVRTAIGYPYYKGSPLCNHGNHNRHQTFQQKATLILIFITIAIVESVEPDYVIIRTLRNQTFTEFENTARKKTHNICLKQ